MTDQLDALDRLAAEKIMGWDIRAIEFGEGLSIWQPTRNIAQAMELIFQMKPIYFNLRQEGTMQTNWRCKIHVPEIGYGEAPTAPEAIVRACLKAKGVEID